MKKDIKVMLTKADVIHQLHDAGIEQGDTVLLHSSLSGIGYVVGAERTIIEAFLEVLGEAGTLITPAQNGYDNGDPQYWMNPPLPEEWWQPVRENFPPFCYYSPIRVMGQMPNYLHRLPGVQRSLHPTTSFLAKGANAEQVCMQSEIFPMFGKNSPLAKMYKLDAKIVMLGTDYETCTALHYAEVLSGAIPTQPTGIAINVPAPTMPLSYEHPFGLEDDSVPETKYVFTDEYLAETDTFAALGEAFELDYDVHKSMLGEALVRTIKMQPLIDFAVDWLREQ
ncbi:aminoglycoside N(3)-acetyltransferase [Culicoidibacter larvae]|uniref:Aminoglycoside N(3)-acetyltransferase n=1 Tax=Culicoidibacter larvae TaxID=2579976 RepID=A0A5R8Q9L1_9FIRM|nr:AAC(3) family N-acetyltransferase [Culicoidibacter larvae]TLG72537.1 AAC(3) family N-acetyltransferase [Culicoidibacter larvae]